MADVYIVLDGARVVGASARLQGAELLRMEEASRLAHDRWYQCGRDAERWDRMERQMYDRLSVVNTELRDVED